jgi:hypothetical protein
VVASSQELGELRFCACRYVGLLQKIEVLLPAAFGVPNITIMDGKGAQSRPPQQHGDAEQAGAAAAVAGAGMPDWQQVERCDVVLYVAHAATDSGVWSLPDTFSPDVLEAWLKLNGLLMRCAGLLAARTVAV